jgi:predicted permease
MADRTYAALLWAFPRRFRSKFGAGMRHAFTAEHARARAVGRLALSRFWFRTIADSLWSGSKERIRPVHEPGSSPFPGVPTERWSRQMFRRLVRDVRIAARRARKHPGFSMATIVTLGVGIGATTAIFSVVHGVLLKPLPYEESEALVDVGHLATGDSDDLRVGLTSGAFFVYSQDGRLVEDVSAYFRFPVNLSDGDRPQRIAAAIATSGLAGTLRSTPALGRWFSAEEDVPGGPAVAVISYGLWQRLFAGSSATVGTTVDLNGETTEIVGVMPRGFRFPDAETEVWVPIRFDESTARSVNFQYSAVGRLLPGAAAPDATAELDNLFPRTVERFPEGLSADELRDLGIRASVVPLKEIVIGDVAAVLWPVMAAVFVILLVACANVANLFLVQAEGRDREIGVRLALGAGRGDVARHFLVESAILGLFGGLVGVALAYGGVSLLREIGPEELPRLHEIGVTLPVLLFAVATSLAVGLLFGMLPAIRVRAATALAGLRSGTRGSSSGPRRNRARNVLVTSQLALALVLLVGAGLMFRTLGNLLNVEPGFDTGNLLTFELAVPFLEAPGQQEGMEFQQRVIDRLSALPGVVSVTASASGLPIETVASRNPVWLEDFPLPPGELPPLQAVRIVMPDYFSTLGIPILEGRPIERRDLENGVGAVVVSAGFARRYWPNESPIGKRLQVIPEGEMHTIVGVAGDTQGDGLDQPANETVYWDPRGAGDTYYTNTHVMTYGVRTRGAPTSVVESTREAIREISGGVAIGGISTMDQWVDASVARISFTMTLLGIAAAMSLLLGSLGVYGVLAYAVSQRRREIGVRMALGARPGTVRRMVVREAGVVIAGGVVIGLVGAGIVSRVLSSLLFGVAPVDMMTYGAVAGLLTVVALVASYLPARRASAVDPALTLRAE